MMEASEARAEMLERRVKALEGKKTTRQLIRDFSLAFERPVNESLTMLTVTDRLLLANLLFEEVREYIDKGLGLTIRVNDGCDVFDLPGELVIEHDEGRVVDPIECADGLADVNVVIHFNAHWQGINLDRATEIVHDSNMSKLAEDGTPIINGVTPGYRHGTDSADGRSEPGYDPNKPSGKILKGPDYWSPTEKLAALIQEERNNRG